MVWNRVLRQREKRDGDGIDNDEDGDDATATAAADDDAGGEGITSDAAMPRVLGPSFAERKRVERECEAALFYLSMAGESLQFFHDVRKFRFFVSPLF